MSALTSFQVADEVDLVPTPREIELTGDRWSVIDWTIHAIPDLTLVQTGVEEINERYIDLEAAAADNSLDVRRTFVLDSDRTNDPQGQKRINKGEMPMSGSDKSEKSSREPNIVMIFADDLGYGDLSCFGSETIATPNLDRLAAEGLRFSDFYAAAPFCSPSRAALLTGRYPARAGVPLVLFPLEKTGLPPEEVTVADLLRGQGYATTCIGKWHLGTEAPFHPTRHGFDEWYGLPYSNDMMVWDGVEPFRAQHALRELPLYDCRRPTDEAAEAPAEQTTLTRRYTERALDFIQDNRDRPFFLYLAHTFPHSPQYASPAFDGKSRGGIYGDTVEELDWSVGRIVETLRETGLDRNTLVFFTSDNGPSPGNAKRIVDGKPRYSGGSTGPLRGKKGQTWEGGMREPAIAWWPGRIQAGRETSAVSSILDLLPTFASLAGAKLPEGVILDGMDLSGLLFGEENPFPEERLFCYYFGCQLQAVRRGPWKLVLPITEYPAEVPKTLWYRLLPELFHRQHRLFPRAELYNLDEDIGEKVDRSDEHPGIVDSLLSAAADFDRALQAERREQVWLEPTHIPGQ